MEERSKPHLLDANEPKYNIREWSRDHTKVDKGTKLSNNDELIKLQNVLNDIEI